MSQIIGSVSQNFGQGKQMLKTKAVFAVESGCLYISMSK